MNYYSYALPKVPVTVSLDYNEIIKLDSYTLYTGQELKSGDTYLYVAMRTSILFKII